MRIQLGQASDRIPAKEVDSELKIEYGLSMIVLQPTSFCNLSCDYCYLREKDIQNRMSLDVARSVSDFLSGRNDEHLRIAWHGGEPLATGLNHFRRLYNEFSNTDLNNNLTHNIQTNGTLLNNNWCSFFRDERFEIGVSIDGDSEMNSRRNYRNGKNSYNATLKGIEKLVSFDIPFSTISVISEESLDKAEKLYYFIKSTGSKSLCVNIEEREGANNGSGLTPSYKVKKFWRDLFETWKSDPTSLKVREIDKTLQAMLYVVDKSQSPQNEPKRKIDIFPSISSKGNVVLLSPELLDQPDKCGYHFVVGNVLESTLAEILESGKRSVYVRDFSTGVKKCYNSCHYFSVCEGGQASNKFYENKDIATTETNFCRAHKQLLFDAILDSLEENKYDNN